MYVSMYVKIRTFCAKPIFCQNRVQKKTKKQQRIFIAYILNEPVYLGKGEILPL